MVSTTRPETIRGEVAEGTPGFVAVRNRTSWAAIWAGLFVTLGIEALFTTLMIGIFASFINPGGASPSGQSFGIGIAAWFFLQTVLAFFCGGWVAGKLAGRVDAGTNRMHAFTVWGFGTLVILYTLVSAGGAAVNATFNLIRIGLGILAGSAMSIGIPGGPGGAPAAGAAMAPGAAATAVSVATWIPIYLFVTFGCAWIAAMLGGNRERETVTTV